MNKNMSITLKDPAKIQHEIIGGQILIKLLQIPNDNLYLWTKKSIQLKSEGKDYFRVIW